MKKNKIIFIVIPLLVFISLIGVGFSSWYFSLDELESTKNISVYTVSNVEKGELSLIEAPSKVVFSQGNGEINNTKDGINFYKEENGAFVESDKVIIKYELKDPNDSIDGGIYRLYVSFSGATFTNIVKLTDIYSSSAEENGGYDIKDDIKRIEATEDEPYGYFLYTLELSNVIEYKSAGSSGVKPIDLEKYNYLSESVKDAKITITVEAI